MSDTSRFLLYYCHACQEDFVSTPRTQCRICHSEFIEELGPADAPSYIDMNTDHEEEGGEYDGGESEYEGEWAGMNEDGEEDDEERFADYPDEEDEGEEENEEHNDESTSIERRRAEMMGAMLQAMFGRESSINDERFTDSMARESEEGDEDSSESSLRTEGRSPIASLLRWFLSSEPGGEAPDIYGWEGHSLFNMFNVVANAGNYVWSQRELDSVISDLMEQTAAQNQPPPASEEAIRALPLVQISRDHVAKSLDCSICQEHYGIGEEGLEMPCKHIYHSECIRQWLQRNGTCPVCRFSLVEVTDTKK
ncbi:uncharacterized protein VTP21DRAFT_3769 [Calcarisporiella thermophila]|uniref:uncharacterized protein n=1 Tax=Calcarisporiella thermophila TaxID=911321 RepID=UPI0037424A1D